MANTESASVAPEQETKRKTTKRTRTTKAKSSDDASEQPATSKAKGADKAAEKGEKARPAKESSAATEPKPEGGASRSSSSSSDADSAPTQRDPGGESASGGQPQGQSSHSSNNPHHQQQNPPGQGRRRNKRKKKKPGQGGGPPQGGHSGGGGGSSGIPSSVLPSEDDLRAEAAELDKIAGTKDYEKAAANALHIAELQKMELDKLHDLAEDEGIDDPATKPRQELIFSLLKARAAKGELMFGEGTLEVMPEGFGFLRQAECSYLSSPDDVYVAPTIIRHMGLRQGMEIRGAIRPPKENERFFALLRIDEVNSGDPARLKNLPVFEDLTPLHPEERFVLETEPGVIETRVVDLVAPIGKGQRALIVAPPRTGKTVLMQKITKAISQNEPDVKIIVLLIDERPEEVTDFRRNTSDTVEVIASTFDEDARRHIQVAEMVMAKARRYVEFGNHVVILLDSITRLARAYNAGAPNTGKIMSGGIDSGALTRPKKFFGSARAIENGGSLTILGTALVDTGSKADEVIFEEFKGTGNSELHLDRKLIEKRIFPAIDVAASGTRREELLLDAKELELVYRLRKVLSDMNVVEAMELLKSRLGKTKTNAEFLMTMNLG